MSFTKTPLNKATVPVIATIFANKDSNPPATFCLADETSVIIGSDSSCGIHLTGPGVSPKHSLLQMSRGRVTVSDWFSESGTILNRETIEQPAAVDPQDVVSIGPYHLRVVVHPLGSDLDSADYSKQSDSTPSTTDAETPSFQETGLPAETAKSAQVTFQGAPENQPADLSKQLEAAQQQIRRLEEELEYQLSIEADEADEADRSPASEPSADVEALHAEIAQLRSELQQRDEDIDSRVKPDSDYDADQAKTARLVGRLEQLLTELEAADQTILGLQEALHAADEAHASEREERRQFNLWVSEIEDRVADRESHWQSSQEALQAQIDEANQRRQEAEENYSNLLCGRDNQLQQKADEQIQQLRQQVQSLQAKLHTTGQKLDEANCLVQRGELSVERMDNVELLHRKLREQELELAQQRAAVTRQRAEMTKLQQQLEHAESLPNQDVDNPDVRLRAFREHLREIHDEEQEEKRQKSLSFRITNLWKRLDSR